MTPTATAEPEQRQTRVFRGRRVEDVLAQVRAELGADAVVLCQREGLVGGFGGFFQQRFYEVEAVAGGPRIDAYDEEPDSEPEWEPLETAPPEPDGYWDEAVSTDAGLEGWAVDADADHVSPVPSAAPSDAAWAEREHADSFADRLARAAAAMPAPTPAPAVATVEEPPRESARARRRMRRRSERRQQEAPAPAPAENPIAQTLADELCARGVEPALAAGLLETAVAHILPFQPAAGLRDATRAAISGSLPTSPPPPYYGAAIAFVGTGGAGKTSCTAALAARYAGSSTLATQAIAVEARGGGSELEALLEEQRIPVSEAQGEQLAQRVASARGGSFVVIDTPAVSPADPVAIAQLGAELDQLALDQTIIALPATLSLTAARQLLHALAPLRPTAIAVTHADETDQLGVAATLACETGIPIAFVQAGLGALAPADPRMLAEQLLP
jgi:Meckel syndrome type 1 protein